SNACDLGEAVEHHVSRIALLSYLTIDAAPYIQLMRIHFVRSRDPGSNRRVGVKGLPQNPLTGSTLPVPDAHIVATAISNADLPSPLPRHIAATLANNRYQLAFVVQLLGHGGKINRIERTGHCCDCLGEPDLLGRYLQSKFGAMIAVVEADGEHFAGTHHRRIES